MCAHPDACFNIDHACGVYAVPCADTHTHTHTHTGIFFKHSTNMSVLMCVCVRARARFLPCISSLEYGRGNACKKEEMRGRERTSRIRERKRMRTTLMCECAHVRALPRAFSISCALPLPYSKGKLHWRESTRVHTQTHDTHMTRTDT